MSMPLVSQNLKLKPGPLVLVPMNNPEHQPDLKRSLHLVIQVGGQRRLRQGGDGRLPSSGAQAQLPLGRLLFILGGWAVTAWQTD